MRARGGGPGRRRRQTTRGRSDQCAMTKLSEVAGDSSRFSSYFYYFKRSLIIISNVHGLVFKFIIFWLTYMDVHDVKWVK